MYARSVDSLIQTSNAFNHVAQTSKAAVVSISTLKTVQTYSPFAQDPFFNQFDLFSQGTNQREGLGSGVIVSKFGHILTNHHVVARTDSITVTLNDGREFSATLVGSDKKTDIALLKIEATNLPIVRLGNSDQLSIGDWAIAIGNPFGLAGTMTVGIISATGRSGVVDADNYADFIQTDAAINPGNSGGALLNINGELIGINTAIFSRSGGYIGIGFAVPVNMAKRVMEDLLAYGRVKRGKLGVTIQPINDKIMREYRLSSREGAYIISVKPGSSADKAGMLPGDIVIELGGKKISDYLSLRSRISELKLNERSYCVVLRNNRKKRLTITLLADTATAMTSIDRLGLQTTEVSADIRRQYRIPQRVDGLFIVSVEQGSLGQRYRLTPGQVITKLNNKPLRSQKMYKRALSSNKPLLVSVYQDGYEFTLLIR